MRLVTRSDFDGLVCAMILIECGEIDKVKENDKDVYDIKFVHPKDVQDGNIELSSNDITTNLPYDSRVKMCFDHHESELLRNADMNSTSNWHIDGDAKSAADSSSSQDASSGGESAGGAKSYEISEQSVAKYASSSAESSMPIFVIIAVIILIAIFLVGYARDSKDDYDDY